VNLASSARAGRSGRLAGSVARVTYIVDYPFNARDYVRFGVETLLERGLEVEVWDLSSLLQPDLLNGAQQPVSSPVTQRRFTSQREVIQAIGRVDASYFVLCIPDYCPATAFLYRAISKSRIRYGLMANTALPVAKRRDVKAPGYLWSKLTRLTPRQVVRSIFARVPPSWVGVRPADAVLVSAESALDGRSLVGPRTDLVRLHSFDYDTYLRIGETSVEVDPGMAVYLDQYMPFHPDWAAYDGGPLILSDKYYPMLRRFFDRLEREANVRVTIAAHPRSEYRAPAEFFGERPIFFNETAQLVRKARFVITETSQSIGFAVLFRKPVVIMTTDAYEASTRSVGFEHREQIRLMARHLGTVAVNIERSDPIDWDRLLTVDNAAYDCYQHRYIKPAGSPRDYYWNIVADYLGALAG
jgi:hypothetical protein